PTWLSALIFLVVITLINVVSVKAFGEFEFWFAIIKVVAIIGLIGLGLLMIFFGIGNGGHPIGLSNLWMHGGFLPNGISGVLLSLVMVMFSFGGVELIGITAGEAENPTKSIPKAINQVVLRILIFYVGALAVMVTIFPWDQVNTNGSPFVAIFSQMGIPAAAAILNVVVLTAALSAYNSGLYSNGRMLHSLAWQGNAPAFLGKVNKKGTPVAGVLISSGITLLTVLLTFLFPGKIFLYLLSIATFATIISWTVILITQLKFRQVKGKDATSRLKFKLPLYPYSSYVCLLFLALVVVMMGFIADMRISLYVAPAWVLILYLVYRIKRK
ncbi:MAG: amino acid permease, partial [Gorillibacterium sp.]|nr:amino acid permease [Gorillibacterium sp.]